MRWGTTRHRSSATGGLHRPLSCPAGVVQKSFDPQPFHRSFFQSAIDCGRTGADRPVLDPAFAQANLFPEEHGALIETLAPPERTTFCLRDPAGFMASATRKLTDVSLEALQSVNYLGSIETHHRIGGEVFVSHPGITPAEYRRLLSPLELPPGVEISHRDTAAPDLTMAAMWDAYDDVFVPQARMAMS